MTAIIDGTNGVTTPNVLTSSSGVALTLQSAGTTAVTIDTSQNVGIGTSSPADKLDVSRVSSSNSTSGLTLTNTDNSGYGSALNWNLKLNSIAGNWGRIYTEAASTTATYMAFQTTVGSTLAERMRIDSSGNLLVGTTSQIFSGKLCIAVNLSTFNPLALQNTTTQGAGQSFMYMANSAGNKAGSIDHTGTTTVAYTTSSDYRMKENIAPMTGALNTVLQLKPCTYTWKEDGKSGQGFIAHELQAVVPDCVSGEKDAVDADGKPKYQGIDTSFLVATLTAAIQELKTIVDTQAAEIAELKAKVA